jgi:hypothetical protein
MKFSFTFTKKDIALPLLISFDFQKSHWLVVVHVLIFAFQAVHFYAPKVYEPETFKATKAYADERQKSPRRRRRKPSKAMRNLYQLG